MVTINTNAVAAYNGGPDMGMQVQAVEALKALEQAERSTQSEAQVQDRVARRTESVIVTISPEARAMVAANAQSASESLPTVVGQAAEPVAATPVSAPVDEAELGAVAESDAGAVPPTAEAQQDDSTVLEAGPDPSTVAAAPEMAVRPAPEVAEPSTTQGANFEQVDVADGGEEPAQRAAADAAIAAESVDGDASDVQPI